MATQKTYFGVWPLTMARTTLGSYAQIMAGDPVPEGLVAPDDLERLVDEGAIGVLEIPVLDPIDPEIELVDRTDPVEPIDPVVVEEPVKPAGGKPSGSRRSS